MDLLRRTVLKGAGASGVLAGLLATGMLKPTLAYANDWNKAAFEAKDPEAALKALGAEGAAANTALVMKAPEIAENGAVVPIDVTSTIPTMRRRLRRSLRKMTANTAVSTGTMERINEVLLTEV